MALGLQELGAFFTYHLAWLGGHYDKTKDMNHDDTTTFMTTECAVYDRIETSRLLDMSRQRH